MDCVVASTGQHEGTLLP